MSLFLFFIIACLVITTFGFISIYLFVTFFYTAFNLCTINEYFMVNLFGCIMEA